jgi:hypothetical protein
VVPWVAVRVLRSVQLLAGVMVRLSEAQLVALPALRPWLQSGESHVCGNVRYITMMAGMTTVVTAGSTSKKTNTGMETTKLQQI